MSHNVYYTCVKFGILQEEPVTYSCLFLTLLISGIMIEFHSKQKVRTLQGWWILKDGVILKIKSIDINSVTFGDCCIKYPGTKRYKLVRRLRSAISIGSIPLYTCTNYMTSKSLITPTNNRTTQTAKW